MSKLRFQKKILLTNLLVILVLMAGLVGYFYSFVIHKEKEQTMDNLSALCTKQQEQLDDMIYNLGSITLHVASNPSIVQLFESLPDQDGNYFASDQMAATSLRNMLSSYVFDNYGFERICLYNDKEDFLYTGSREIRADAIQSFFQSDRFTQIKDDLAAQHGRLFVGVSQDPFQRPSGEEPLDMIFSIVREIKNYTLFDNTVSGYVEIQQSVEEIAALFETISPSIRGYLVSRTTGELLYPLSLEGELAQSDYQEICRAMLDQYGKTEHETHIKMDGDTFVACRNLDELDCMVVLVQHQSAALQSLYQFIYMILITLALILLVVCVVELFIMKRLTRPLDQLVQSVRKISLDNLTVYLEPNGTDELETLSTAFHNVFQQLNQSIQELVKSRTSQLESNLLALQAQVNPHFIHNTLSLISAIAEENNTPKITDICNDLSDMLRFTTSYKSTTCTLQEEISYALCYLKLMRERYDTLFQFSLEVDQSLNGILIPKLVLYPLLENCFSHAFKPIRPPWDIQIRSWREGDSWMIEVRDNGVGFDQETLQSIHQFLEQLREKDCLNQLSELEIGGLCIRSTALRLRLHYGERMIFKIENLPERGTRVLFGDVIESKHMPPGPEESGE